MESRCVRHQGGEQSPFVFVMVLWPSWYSIRMAVSLELVRMERYFSEFRRTISVCMHGSPLRCPDCMWSPELELELELEREKCPDLDLEAGHPGGRIMTKALVSICFHTTACLSSFDAYHSEPAEDETRCMFRPASMSFRATVSIN